MSIISFVNRVCVQTALYWEPDGNDGYGATFKTPVDIKCRWDDIEEVDTDDAGKEFVSKASLLITQELQFGGWVALAKLADYTPGSINNPKAFDRAYEIAKFTSTPLFRKTDQFVRTVKLKTGTDG